MVKAPKKLNKSRLEDNEWVWGNGDEKAFKLVDINIDEQLKWDNHIAYTAKKLGYANYSLNKAQKWLNTRSKNFYTVVSSTHT